jgi:hypothetical protein
MHSHFNILQVSLVLPNDESIAEKETNCNGFYDYFRRSDNFEVAGHESHKSSKSV